MVNTRPQRVANWLEILQHHLAKMASTPFVYGRTDCYYEVIGAIDLMLGSSHLDDFKGAYTCQKSALRAMTKAGFRSFVDYLDTFLEKIPVSAALVGDVSVVADNAGMEHFSLCVGTHWRVRTPAGIRRTHPQDVIAAFKVG